jgi:hypothetical protein
VRTVFHAAANAPSSSSSFHARASSKSNSEIVGALNLISSAAVEPSIVAKSGGITRLVELFYDARVFPHPQDRLPLVAALNVLAGDSDCLSTMIAAGVLDALSHLAMSASHFAVPTQGAHWATATPSQTRHVGERVESACSVSRLVTTLPPPLWDAVIRTISKILICSPESSFQAIQGDALSIIAAAALPGEPMSTRVRAAAGLATAANWSGPRYAIEIIETPNVVASMSAILTDPDQRIAPHVRRATLDGLTVMAHRGQARVLLKQRGCDEFISAAARRASRSGDLDIAARSTVAAGHLAGHSVDEFGFLVASDHGSDAALDYSSDDTTKSPLRHAADERNSFRRAPTGLAIIQSEVMTERGFTAQEDVLEVDCLRDIDGGRQIARQCAPDHSHSNGERGIRGRRVASSTQDDFPDVAIPRKNSLSRKSGLQESSQNFHLASNSDCPVEGLETRRAGAVVDAELSSSPLVDFSSAATRAAGRDVVNALQRKTTGEMESESKDKYCWESVLEQRPTDLSRSADGRVRAYQDLSRVPIPSSLRPRVWARLLEVPEARSNDPGLYKRLCESLKTATLPEDYEHTISADVTRTMPLHCLFWAGGAQIGVESLRSVLRCYALHVPEVGYCQGMSSIAALLLMNSEGEEEAFLMLNHFMSNYGYKDVFLPGFPQYKKWLEELRPVIASYMPELNSRFDRENIFVELYADKWLITALTHNFPHRHLVRIWDLMLLSGSPKIILKACLAVLHLAEPKLLQLNFDGMMNYLMRGFWDPETGVLPPDKLDEFLKCARGFRLAVPETPLEVSKPEDKGGNDVSQSGGRKNPLSCCFACFGKAKVD